MLNFNWIKKLVLLGFIIGYTQAEYASQYDSRYDSRYNQNTNSGAGYDQKQNDDDPVLDQSVQNLGAIFDGFFNLSSIDSENRRFVDNARSTLNIAVVYYALKNNNSDKSADMLDVYYSRGISKDRSSRRLTVSNNDFAKILTNYAARLDFKDANNQKRFVAVKQLVQTTVGDDVWAQINSALDPKLQDGSDLFDQNLKIASNDNRAVRFMNILTQLNKSYDFDTVKAFFKATKDNTNDYFMYQILYNLKASNSAMASVSDKLYAKYFTNGKPEAVADFKITKDMYAKIITDFAKTLNLNDDKQKTLFKGVKAIVAKAFGDKKWKIIHDALDPSLQDNTDADDKQLNQVPDHLKNFVTLFKNFYTANGYEPTKKFLAILQKDSSDYFVYKLLYLAQLTDDKTQEDVSKKLQKHFFKDVKPQADDSVKINQDFYVKVITDYAATLDLTDANQQKTFNDFKANMSKTLGNDTWKKIQAGLDPSLRDKVADTLFGSAFSSQSLDLKDLKNLINNGQTDPLRLKAQFIIDLENLLLDQQNYTQADGTKKLSGSFSQLTDQYKQLLSKAQVDASFLADVQKNFATSMAQDTPLITGDLVDLFTQSLGKNPQMLMNFQAGYRVDIQATLNAAATGEPATFDVNGLLLLCVQVLAKLEATPNADNTPISIDDFSKKYPTALNQVAIMLKNRGNIDVIVKDLYTRIQQMLPKYNAQIVFAANVFALLDTLGFSDQQKTVVAQKLAQILASKNVNANDVNAYIIKRKKTADALISLNQVDPQKIIKAIAVQTNSDTSTPSKPTDAATNATSFLQSAVSNLLGKFTG
ncbi:MAG: hypothetical protein NEHIOOID_01107 [Holosporales bacterium]